VSRDWLSQLATGFAVTQADALAGRALNPFQENTAACAAAYLIEFLYEYWQDERGSVLAVVSNNVAYRAWVFRAVGGYDEAFRIAGGEDMEMGCRLVAGGWSQLRHPAAQVSHHHRMTPVAHLRQQFRYGLGGHRFHLKQQQLVDRGGIRPVRTTAFYRHLFDACQRDRVPVAQCALLAAGQVAYRLGNYWGRHRSGGGAAERHPETGSAGGLTGQRSTVE
jgi:hypothetical protein